MLCPYLFNRYSANIIRRVCLEEIEYGVRIGLRNITNLRYADYTTRLAQTEKGLEMLLNRVKKEIWSSA